MQTYELPDKDTAIAILTLKYGVGMDWTKLLFEACATGDIELVSWVIASEYVDIHARNDKALAIATSRGNQNVVKLLLSLVEYSADVLYENVARATSHADIFELLLDTSGVSNLFKEASACYKWYTDMTVVLVLYEVDVQEFDKRLVKYASSRGYKVLLEMLYEKFIDINIEDLILTTAYQHGHTDIVDWMVGKIEEQRQTARRYMSYE